jgi:hypothetical protein
LCDNSAENDSPNYDKNLNPFESSTEPASSSKTRFSLTEMKLSNFKHLMKTKKGKGCSNMCLKITTSKLRCSIKVKEEFENDACELCNI